MAVFVRLRLGILMFLQYFMMGSWFVPFGSYMSKGLKFDAVIGFAYGSQGIATILSALLVGILADRYFSAQRLLACLFSLASITLCALAFERHSVQLFLGITFLHFLFFIPTIPLANSICFRWLETPQSQFPRLRVLGTLGWIVSGIVVGTIAGAAESELPLLIGAATGAVLAIYCLSLPHTPPLRQGSSTSAGAILGFDALREQADKSFWILLWATLLTMLPMAFYYAYCNTFLIDAGTEIHLFGERFEATAVQSLGQASEIAFLLVLPVCLKRFGIRGVFLLGIASWILRYALFAGAYDGKQSILWMLLLGVLLHGAANDFIQVAGQIYVNQSFGEAARARAQALFTTVLMGVGAVLGSVIANWTYVALSTGTQHDWSKIWMVPTGAAMVTFVWFALRFHPHESVRARTAP